MKKRSFDEMIAYFNRRVSEMDIDHDYKMELLGMVTAIGYKHEQTAQHWIPCSERLPETDGEYLACDGDCVFFSRLFQGEFLSDDAIAWMPLPNPYEGDSDD